MGRMGGSGRERAAKWLAHCSKDLPGFQGVLNRALCLKNLRTLLFWVMRLFHNARHQCWNPSAFRAPSGDKRCLVWMRRRIRRSSRD